MEPDKGPVGKGNTSTNYHFLGGFYVSFQWCSSFQGSRFEHSIYLFFWLHEFDKPGRHPTSGFSGLIALRFFYVAWHWSECVFSDQVADFDPRDTFCLRRNDLDLFIWVFPKNRGGPPKWMVYNGNPYENGWFGDTTIFGNTHLYKVIFYGFDPMGFISIKPPFGIYIIFFHFPRIFSKSKMIKFLRLATSKDQSLKEYSPWINSKNLWKLAIPKGISSSNQWFSGVHVYDDYDNMNDMNVSRLDIWQL